MNTYVQDQIAKVDVSDVLNKHTGEILDKSESVAIGTIESEVFTGISTLDISKEISDKLTRPVDVTSIEIKPTGQIYLCHIQYRKMLNDAFGMGNWALRPLSGFTKIENIVCREYALYIRGKYAASAIGEQAYIESNDQMTWSDACEATKSNAIMRCCKDLGIGLEMWDKKFVGKFIKEHCIQVWRKGKPKPQYRLTSSEPWFDETGIVVPNEKQTPAQGTSPEPQGQPSISGGAIGMVTGIRKETKTNRTTKKEFIVYHIKLDNNIEYTASGKDAESLMTLAKTAATNGFQVKINTKGDQYNTIIKLDTVEPDFNEPELTAVDDINSEPLPWETEKT